MCNPLPFLTNPIPFYKKKGNVYTWFHPAFSRLLVLTPSPFYVIQCVHKYSPDSKHLLLKKAWDFRKFLFVNEVYVCHFIYLLNFENSTSGYLTVNAIVNTYRFLTSHRNFDIRDSPKLNVCARCSKPSLFAPPLKISL